MCWRHPKEIKIMRIDISLPENLASKTDKRWKDLGYSSRSEYLRSLIMKDLPGEATSYQGLAKETLLKEEPESNP